MALAKNARTIISNQSNAASATIRGRLDLNGAQGGGFLTASIVNGGTGPSAQCVCTVMVAHNATLPALGAAGADWKTIAQFGGGLLANFPTPIALPIDPAIMCLQVEFTGNLTQAVTVEAFFSELTTVG